MNASEFDRYEKAVIVIRNSADFSLEIIGYVPLTTPVKDFLANNLDRSLVPPSVYLVKAVTFEFNAGTGVLTSDPLIPWDPNLTQVAAVFTDQVFYMTQPSPELEQAYRAAYPL